MKPGDTAFHAIFPLARGVRDLQERAAHQYRPVAAEILRIGNRDSQTIEHTLDGMLDFCGHDAVLAMYRQLCRHYWPINPAAAAFYVTAYRERWDADESGGLS
jgi:hypothetical protein